MAAVRKSIVVIVTSIALTYTAILEAARLIVDTRNALGAARRSSPKVISL
jgi:hypothetical protein